LREVEARFIEVVVEAVSLCRNSGREELADVSLDLEGDATGRAAVAVAAGVESDPKERRSLSPKRVSELLNDDPKSKFRSRRGACEVDPDSEEEGPVDCLDRLTLYDRGGDVVDAA
jgi:hypothetical protein